MRNYRGFQQYARDGRKCQRWDSQSPNWHSYGHYGAHNYCRNIDGDESTLWCYNSQGIIPRWEYCDPLREDYCDSATRNKCDSDWACDKTCPTSDGSSQVGGYSECNSGCGCDGAPQADCDAPGAPGLSERCDETSVCNDDCGKQYSCDQNTATCKRDFSIDELPNSLPGEDGGEELSAFEACCACGAAAGVDADGEDVMLGRCVNPVVSATSAEPKENPELSEEEAKELGLSLTIAGSIEILGAVHISALLELYLSPLEDDYKIKFETFAPIKILGDLFKFEAHPDPEKNGGKLGPSFEMKFGVGSPMYLKAQGRFYVFGWSANGYAEMDPDAGTGVFELTDLNFAGAGFTGFVRLEYNADELSAKVEGQWRNDPDGPSLVEAMKAGIEKAFEAVRDEADAQWKAAGECNDRYWDSCDSGCNSACDDCGVLQIPDGSPCDGCAIHRLDMSCDTSCDEVCDTHCAVWICTDWCDSSCDFFCDDCSQKTIFCTGCTEPWQDVPLVSQGCDESCILGCGPGCSEDCDDALFWGCDDGCSPDTVPWEAGVPADQGTPDLFQCIGEGLMAVLLEVAALALEVFNAIAQELLSVVDPQDFVDVYELDFSLFCSLSDFGETGFYWRIQYQLFRIFGGPVVESELIFKFDDIVETVKSIAEEGWEIAKSLLGFRRRRAIETPEPGLEWTKNSLRHRTGFGVEWGDLANATAGSRERRAHDHVRDLDERGHDAHNALVEEALHQLVIKTLDPDPEVRSDAEAWWSRTFHPGAEDLPDVGGFHFD
jgi:hypothetical protein